MPHEPGHNGQYVIKSTGEPYNGPVFKDTNGEIYTTTTGAREGYDGFSIGGQLLVLSSESTIQRPPQQTQQTNVGNENPVTRLFRAPTTPRYYRPDGTIVPIGAELHQHLDGTVMTKHTMQGFGTPDGSVVVTTVSPSRGARTNGTAQTSGRRTRTRGRNQTRTQQNNMNRRAATSTPRTTQTQTTRTQTTQRRTQTSGGGMGGGRTGGGGGY